MLEQDNKLSKAQQVRQAAFFMARQMGGYDHQTKPSLKDIFDEAERVEDWMWKANETRGLGKLLEAVERAIILLRAEGTAELRDHAYKLEKALQAL